MTILVESNIPIHASPKGAPAKYPFRRLAVGDSFFTKEPLSRVSPCAIRCGKRWNMKFRCRTMDGGVRVWRIA